MPGVAVTGVEVTSLGSTAVSISGGDRPTLQPAGHSVTNCTIHSFAKVQWCYHPGVKIAGVGNTVMNNEIFDAPHQGVLVGGNNHLVNFNVKSPRHSSQSLQVFKQFTSFVVRECAQLHLAVA
jgi:hypothetical protein